jgi:hypothetical protein
MRSGRGIVFHVVCALSLILAVVVVGLWVGSFGGEFHVVSFIWGGERMTAKIRWGQFVIFGPPGGANADAEEVRLAGKMSNDDFDWKALAPAYVEGVARSGSATWKAYQKFRRRTWMVDDAMARTWLAGMDDPGRFLPAHMMLLHAAEERRKQYFHRSSAWREAGFRTSPVIVADEEPKEPAAMQVDPVLYFAVDKRGGPDLSRRQQLCEEWHDVLDEKRGAVFVGWFFLGVMILPLAWVARPKWERRTRRRWLMNGLALVSMIICVMSAGMWVRSYWVDEEFGFATRPGAPLSPGAEKMLSRSWVGSSRGKLRMVRVDYSPLSMGMPSPAGYRKGIAGVLLGDLFGPGRGAKDERELKMPGIDFYHAPVQMGRVLFASSLVGIWRLSVSWWVVVAVSVVGPLIWARRAGVMWGRRRRERKIAGKICLKCGYDMRATPGRCPECGSVREEVICDFRVKTLTRASPRVPGRE